MNERFKTPCAVMLMLMRKSEKGEEILLQKRQNTGLLMDSMIYQHQDMLRIMNQ